MAKARSESHLATLLKSLESALLKESRIRAFLAPIRHLPPELLSEVLLNAYKFGVSPWIFTQVSGLWRATAFNLPRIWNKVRYSHLLSSPRNSSGFEKSRTWGEFQNALLRSRGAPLDLEVFIYSSDKSLLVVDGLQFPSSVLDPVADRLESFLLYLSMPSTYTTIVTQPLKSLKQLDISGNMDLKTFKDFINVVDATALDLWKLKLGFTTDMLSPDLAIWSRITHLEVSGNMPLPILSQLVNVRTLHLRGEISPLSNSLSLVTFSKLENANIRNPHVFSSHIFAPIMRGLQVTGKFVSLPSSSPIRLPSLQELEITSSPTIYVNFCIAPLLKSMKMNSGGSILGRNPNQMLGEPNTISLIEVLELGSVTIQGEVLMEMLEYHTNIKELRLHQVSCTPFILPRLSPAKFHPCDEKNESKEILCPSLERLSVQFASRNYSQATLYEQLQSIVTSRSLVECPLSQLLFHRYRWGRADGPTDLVNTPNDYLDDVQST